MALTPEGTPYVESSDLVANYPAASLSLANRVDLVGVLPFATSTARGTAIPTPTNGQYSYLQDTNSTEFYNGSAWVAANGKILQIVRATDTTTRSTNSTTFVDVSGMSITITLQRSTSSVIIIAIFNALSGSGTTLTRAYYQLTDSSNNTLSGAQSIEQGLGAVNSANGGLVTAFAYVTPGTISPVTYKLRFRTADALSSANVLNAGATGQLYAIEVSA